MCAVRTGGGEQTGKQQWRPPKADGGFGPSTPYRQGYRQENHLFKKFLIMHQVLC